jgi:hypothetical protein
MGKKIKVASRGIATAMVFFSRFYVTYDFFLFIVFIFGFVVCMLLRKPKRKDRKKNKPKNKKKKTTNKKNKQTNKQQKKKKFKI